MRSCGNCPERPSDRSSPWASPSSSSRRTSATCSPAPTSSRWGAPKRLRGVDGPVVRKSRSALMWLLTLVLGAALLYAGLVLVTALFQTKMLFPAQMAAANRPSLPPSAERLELMLPDGDRLAGVRLGPSAAPKPVLLGFGGNAWNADAMAL